MRYGQLIELIAHHKPRTIVEIGTWNGERALEMAAEALKYNDNVVYMGYDLFDHATDETDEKELNVKQHFTKEDVDRKLKKFADENPGFDFRLYAGDTNDTLENITADFVFIDGGHSVKTIESDYLKVKDSKVVVFDDYYEKDSQGHGPDTAEFGCNKIIEKHEINHVLLPAVDPVYGGGTVRMAITPASAFPGQINLVVKTRNCVATDRIQANIKYSTTLLKQWIVECSPHGGAAIFCSGGPSLAAAIPEIKKMAKKKDHYVFAVKHAHDTLIENGIVPWGCMLLDPRPHVQDFIENPHKNVRYFVASMCHPSTFDRLMDANASVWGYHAHVGADEDSIIPQVINGRNQFMVGGGSTSATRGISVLHALGFGKFLLFGYDSCYYEPQDKTVKTKTGEQRYHEVEISGRKFWTDLELLAQAQDFQKMLEVAPDLRLEVFGDGLIPHIWKNHPKKHPEFKDIYG